MQDINKPNRNNLGGVLRFNFINVNDVLSIDNPVNSILSQAVQLKPGKQWYAGYGTMGTIGYTEPPEQTNAGIIYKRQFVASCPYDSDVNTQLFDEMRHSQFIVDYTDNNGLRKLIGTIDEPLNFTALLNTKTKLQELPGHLITFFGDGTKKAVVYDI